MLKIGIWMIKIRKIANLLLISDAKKKNYENTSSVKKNDGKPSYCL